MSQITMINALTNIIISCVSLLFVSKASAQAEFSVSIDSIKRTIKSEIYFGMEDVITKNGYLGLTIYASIENIRDIDIKVPKDFSGVFDKGSRHIDYNLFLITTDSTDVTVDSSLTFVCWFGSLSKREWEWLKPGQLRQFKVEVPAYYFKIPGLYALRLAVDLNDYYWTEPNGSRIGHSDFISFFSMDYFGTYQ